jgi:hypothetical protein
MRAGLLSAVIDVNITTRIFKRPMADRFMGSCPTLLEPTISRIFVGHQASAPINILADCVMGSLERSESFNPVLAVHMSFIAGTVPLLAAG